MKEIDPRLLLDNCSCNQLFGLLLEQNRRMIDSSSEPDIFGQSPLSCWSISQHLEHLIYTSKTGLALLLQALESPAPGVEPMNELGQELLRRGSFPRGQTQAPDFALPRDINQKKLTKSLGRLLSQMEDISSRDGEIGEASSTSIHPILGGFTPRNWLQFIALHQNHHLEIIAEIIS